MAECPAHWGSTRLVPADRVGGSDRGGRPSRTRPGRRPRDQVDAVSSAVVWPARSRAAALQVANGGPLEPADVGRALAQTPTPVHPASPCTFPTRLIGRCRRVVLWRSEFGALTRP